MDEARRRLVKINLKSGTLHRGNRPTRLIGSLYAPASDSFGHYRGWPDARDFG
jgi:hypothetical protein